ncbi:MAG: RimK family alpha-L-glutamate ligase [Saprospiraceae bacterium]|nr:RimK family alpha-L-glutamate ligase [Saprospiraceae bacterium]
MRFLILSRNPSLYSTQSLLRACYRRGHQARVIDHVMCDLMVDQGELSIFYQGVKIEGYDAIIPRIGSSVTLYGTNVIRQFQLQGIFSATRAEAILKTRNKWRCYQLLAAEGIQIPKSLLPNFAQLDTMLLQEHFETPLVVKLQESTHGLGVILSESYHNAASTIEAFSRLKESAMIQTYVKESKGVDIRVLVVDGQVVASMRREARDGEFRSNLHRGATARIETLSEEEIFLSRKVCKIMGLDVAGVDILRSKKGPLVLEINSSPGLEGIETVSGKDVAGDIIKYVERRVRRRKKGRTSKTRI